MKILINCESFLKSQYTGIGRYTSSLVHYLAKVDHENNYYLYVKKRLFDRKKRIPQIGANNFKIKRDYFKLGVNRMLRGIDIYHSPSLDSLPMSKAKIVVTIHDCVYRSFPQGHTPEAIQSLETYTQEAVQKASMLICVSKNTKEDMVKYYSVVPEKLQIIYHGVDENIFYPMSPEALEVTKTLLDSKGIKDPFILCVGTIEPRKNIKGVIQAFYQLKKTKKFSGKLVVIGMYGWLQSSLFDFIEKLDLKNDILFLNYVSTEELCCFYNHAEVFVYPSFYEGFGFPILEALSCGAAVVTSNISSCPEVAADAALTVNPYDSEAIAQAIILILENSDLKKSLKAKALLRAKYFSLLRTAQQTLDVYRKIMET
ncbi:MAG: glycosyltransferase family 4 protein [Deltaproteobacteria bacterium]|nr:glycosyltransferase family 4 protein [Deltaproteobacteria bacterium]MBI3018226.1 glycosyltransferase family 4 protein [Deltaproteobacteria bacterium]